MDTGTVNLELEVDTDDAFQMFVEYVYLSDYDPPKGLERDQKCLLHTRVYVLAERLCMDDLKCLALEKMVTELASAYRRPATLSTMGWGNMSDDGRYVLGFIQQKVSQLFTNRLTQC